MISCVLWAFHYNVYTRYELMINSLNIVSPKYAYPTQIWEYGICIGIQCCNAVSYYEQKFQLVSGIVLVGESYKFEHKSSLSQNVFILRVINEFDVEAVNQFGNRFVIPVDKLLNTDACIKI